MIDLFKRALLQIELAYWRRFRPSKYTAYVAFSALEGCRKGVESARNSIAYAALAARVAAASKTKEAAPDGMRADIALLDENPRAET